MRCSAYAYGAGILGGLLAAIFGAVDWWAIPPNTRAKALGIWHGIGNVIVVVLFAINWWLRSTTDGYIPSDGAFTLSCTAIALALLTGWLGGELVERLGIGVDSGAHPNAPNSLSSRAASESAPEFSDMHKHHPGRA